MIIPIENNCAKIQKKKWTHEKCIIKFKFRLLSTIVGFFNEMIFIQKIIDNLKLIIILIFIGWCPKCDVYSLMIDKIYTEMLNKG